jgi:crotonobetainyl-CoA:carnitine CoA-transferase CaiB-like acyl-CoA transferase
MAGALSDLKVIELGELASAPYATKLMADMGAEVIKIERPDIGDRSRQRGPFPKDQPNPETSGMFLYLNTNKYGITLDVASAEGFEIFGKLIATADVLIHNVIPPEMDRIGLAWEKLRKINPKLVMTSITPWGTTGPYRDCRAEDLTTWAGGGVNVLNGGGPEHPDLPPLKCFGHQSGYQGGVHGAVATMGAVIARMRDGEGQHIDVAEQEAVAAQLEMTFEYWPYMKMIATRLGQKPLQPVETMQAKDGYIYICCIEEHQWRAFVDLMGNPEWGNEEIFANRLVRALNWDALKVFLEEYVSQQTVLDLYRKAQARRIPFAPVSTMGDLVKNDHLKARGFFVEIAQPVAGTHKYPGAPLKYEKTPWQIRMPAPTLGQHNEEIFVGRLGMTSARINELKRKGVI